MYCYTLVIGRFNYFDTDCILYCYYNRATECQAKIISLLKVCVLVVGVAIVHGSKIIIQGSIVYHDPPSKKLEHTREYSCKAKIVPYVVYKRTKSRYETSLIPGRQKLIYKYIVSILQCGKIELLWDILRSKKIEDTSI